MEHNALASNSGCDQCLPIIGMQMPPHRYFNIAIGSETPCLCTTQGCETQAVMMFKFGHPARLAICREISGRRRDDHVLTINADHLMGAGQGVEQILTERTAGIATFYRLPVRLLC